MTIVYIYDYYTNMMILGIILAVVVAILTEVGVMANNRGFE